MPIKRGDIVEVHYTGKFEDGEEFDSSRTREPLVFKVGQGEIIKGFEDAVVGMEIGEKKEITIIPENAYGEYKEELVQKVPKDFLRGRDVKKGDILELRAPGNQLLRALVCEVDEDSVTFDLNHPLAGKVLKFEIEIVGIK